MSISGILASGFLQRRLSAPSTPYQQGIEQLGKDLQSGNLAAAQSDFATLQKAFSASPISTAAASAASAASTSNTVAQAFNQLATDLQSGNLSAAQKDFSALQQDVKNLSGPGATNRFHHYHSLSTGSGDSTNSTSSVPQPQPPIFIGGAPNPEPPILIGRGGYPEPLVSGPPVSTGGLYQPERPMAGPPVSVFA